MIHKIILICKKITVLFLQQDGLIFYFKDLAKTVYSIHLKLVFEKMHS